MRLRLAAVAAALAALSTTVPAGALPSTAGSDAGVAAARNAAPPLSSLAAYRGLASWVDMYNAGMWRRPERKLAAMKRHGVDTVYVETSNYNAPTALYRRDRLVRYVEGAHARRMKVVAWYVPSFRNLRFDMRRIRAALNFRTPRHQRFDGFALDIESTAVRSIARRNRRLMTLSSRLRRVVGPNRALGAIIPDPAGQRYWTRFPYRGVARHFDIFLPMGYWTYRVRGYRNVYRFTRKNINIIRTATGRPHEPVHLIGGLADVAGNTEVKAFVTASRDFGALGASLYDYPITRRAEWRILRTVR